jgi:hypothetical protein
MLPYADDFSTPLSARAIADSTARNRASLRYYPGQTGLYSPRIATANYRLNPKTAVIN